MKTIEDLQKVASASLYRIIVDPIEVQTESESGLIQYTQETIDNQKYLRYYGKVIDIGPLAFSAAKFVDEDGVRHRACEVGDWIVYGQHTGVDLCIREDNGDVRRMRVINDDNVLSLIHDIEQVKIPLV